MGLGKPGLICCDLGLMCDWYSCLSSTEFHADAIIENENKCRVREQSYIICPIPQALKEASKKLFYGEKNCENLPIHPPIDLGLENKFSRKKSEENGQICHKK